MPTSFVRTFSEPDQFAAAIRPAHAQSTLIQRGRYAAELTAIDLDQVSLRRFEVNLAQIARAELAPERVVLSFLLGPTEAMLAGGLEMRPRMIVQHNIGRTYYQRILGPTVLGHLLLPLPAMAAIAEISGGKLAALNETHAITTHAHAIQRLLALHADAIRLACDAPDMLSRPGAAHGLEQALIEAVSDCFASVEVVTSTFTQRSHEVVMRRFDRVLEENSGARLFIPDICARIGVSTRTFRECCREHLGIGPKRFLQLRRMHLVRRALTEAEPDKTTVTDVATEYGFWELGRFAGRYKDLFHELPSATLLRSPAPTPGGEVIAATARRAAATADSWFGRRWAAALGPR